MAEAVFKALTSYRLPAGGGSETIKTSGVLEINTTQAATGANTDETDLWSYTLPANTLNANGKGVRITVWWSLANNGNTKNMRVYFGATALQTDTTTAANCAATHTAIVVRTSATAQETLQGGMVNSAARGPIRTTPAETLSGAVIIKATGQNGTANANDIVFRGAMVEYLDL